MFIRRRHDSCYWQVFDWQRGTPPSASEAVDIAKVNKIAATNRRVTFFISVSPSIKI
jgi:hypothetical protein